MLRWSQNRHLHPNIPPQARAVAPENFAMTKHQAQGSYTKEATKRQFLADQRSKFSVRLETLATVTQAR